MSRLQKFTTRAAKGVSLALALTAAVAVRASAQEGAMPTMLSVDNQRGVPVVVYLEQGAYDSRIGTVAAHRMVDLRLPISLRDGEKIFLTVHPENGMDLQTPDGMTVRRGETLKLVVPTNDAGFEPTEPETIPNPGISGPTLTVDNAGNRPAVVFLEQGEFDKRIGTVPSQREQTFPLPPYLIEGAKVVDIFVHVEGGADLASHEFQITPDAHLMLEVPK